MPDYEEAISQSMKQQPPPPYYQVAMAPNQLVLNMNTNGNHPMHAQATTHVPSTAENHDESPNSIPPAYEENENRTSAPTNGSTTNTTTGNQPDVTLPERSQNQH